MSTSHEERVVVIGALQRVKRERDTVPNSLVRAAADRLHLTPEQIRRLIKNGPGTPRGSFVPTEKHIDALYAAHGVITKAYQICLEEGIEVGVGERQFRRGFKERVDQAIVAGAKLGWSGVVSRRAFGPKYVPHKGHTYAIDSSPTCVLVLHKPGGKVIDLYETSVIDEATRFALVVATTDGAPDTVVTIAALAAAVGGYDADDGTPLGGIPEHVLSDNGSELKGHAVTSGLIRYGLRMPLNDDEVDGGLTKRQFTNPDSPWENGRAERFHKTFQRGFCLDLPGYVDPELPEFQRLERRDYWKANPHLLLTRDQFDALLARWVIKYNFEKPHASLNNKTPFAAWVDDPRVLSKPDPEALRLAMLNDGTRVVDKGSIKAFSHIYYGADLGGHDGRTVEIRYLPGRLEHIHVFYRGRFIGLATREDHITDKHRGQIKQHREKQTVAHLAHSANGERLKTERARKQLTELGFAEEELPGMPPPAPAEREAERKERPRVATDAERAALAALVSSTTDDEEFIA